MATVFAAFEDLDLRLAKPARDSPPNRPGFRVRLEDILEQAFSADLNRLANALRTHKRGVIPFIEELLHVPTEFSRQLNGESRDKGSVGVQRRMTWFDQFQ